MSEILHTRSFEYDASLENLDPNELIEGDILTIATEDEQVYELIVVQNIENVLIVRCNLNGQDRTGIVNDTIIQTKLPLTTNFPAPLNKTESITQIVVSNPEAENDVPLDQRTTTKFTRVQVAQAMESGDTNEAKETIAIGDSNGNYENFCKNMRSTGVIDNNEKWIAGNKKVKIHGDILADRGTEGFKILAKIVELRKEARVAGGDITIIAGNHEYLILAFLLNGIGIFKDEEAAIGNCMIGDQQGKGLAELTAFTGDGTIITDLFKATIDRLDRDEILRNMRASEYGLMILNEIANMKLCDQVGDTLYVHTDPTNAMLQMILSKGVDGINNEFQESIREPLLTGEEFDKSKGVLFDTFLHPSNRTFVTATRAAEAEGATNIPAAAAKKANISHDLLKQLKASGVNRIVFGHSNLKRGNRIINIENIEFVNVDQGGNDDTVSAAKIPRKGRRSGRVETGTMIHSQLSP